MISPLPPYLVDELFSYILSSHTPIPDHLLSQYRISRNKFLPPSPSNLDSQYSSTPGHAIHSRLAEISNTPELSTPPIRYAWDQEMFIASHSLQNLQIIWEYDQHRGWVLRGIAIATEDDGLEWSESLDRISQRVSEEDYSAEKEEDIDPGDYWKDFSPVQQTAELVKDEEIDDYWAQYDGGDSTNEPIAEETTPASPLLKAPTQAEALETLMQSLPALNSLNPSTSSELPTKLVNKIAMLLRKTWIDFSSGCEGDDEWEQKGLEWIEICRRVVQAKSNRELNTHHIVSAKVDLLRDMYMVLAEEDVVKEDGFWLLVEEAIRVQLIDSEDDP